MRERTDVPRDVVAPADSLNPMDRSRGEPDYVAGTLKEAINWDSQLKQFLKDSDDERLKP